MTLNYPTPVLAEDFCKALQDAGVLAPSSFYKRIAIIAEPHEVVRIEVELEADDRLISVIPSLGRAGT